MTDTIGLLVINDIAISDDEGKKLRGWEDEKARDLIEVGIRNAEVGKIYEYRILNPEIGKPFFPTPLVFSTFV